MFKSYKGKLFCFSPPVMLATLLVEIGLAVYTLWRYKTSNLTKLVVLLLVLLGIFQLAEYMVCGGLGLSGVDWSRVGFIAITLLPPLALHSVFEIAGKKNRPLIVSAYVGAVIFTGYFALASSALTGNQCLGNYVIFQMPLWVTWLYTLYYYGWIIGGTWKSIRFAKGTKDVRKRRALYLFATGFVSFLLPTTTINLLAPETINGIPSIMCGFAIIFALIITIGVLPRVATRR